MSTSSPFGDGACASVLGLVTPVRAVFVTDEVVVRVVVGFGLMRKVAMWDGRWRLKKHAPDVGSVLVNR